MAGCVLAIDQGTTSTRAMVFDGGCKVVSVSQKELPQHYPQPGWVEHDPEDIWQAVLETCRAALNKAGLEARDIASIGITNQRETTVLWDRKTGIPIHRAIVWQDRRTAEICRGLRERGVEEVVRLQSGLLLDPYFSATKIGWLLDAHEGARGRAEAGELAFGTIDTFLLWRLTGGTVHATDATNASRTMLYDIVRGAWSQDLLDMFGVPRALLPEVRDCASDYGVTVGGHFGGPIAIGGIAGDQQAATIGQACFEPGMMKSTYGTGCFALLNTGDQFIQSSNR
ncbi:MAG TPA: FGGY family carbohydrate kinase, partial [Hyphomicrobiaceae bacterium]|nr:FGGY family carbohydrate kinase [Hyphomicrobiaceae bacterium]